MTKAYASFCATIDPACVRNGEDRHDVCLFSDPACTKPIARYMWYNGSKPNSVTKNVVVRGVAYEVFWA